MGIELLRYRDAEQPAGRGDSFAEPLDHMSPAFPRMMPICFRVRDDVDFNTFIADLEAEAASVRWPCPLPLTAPTRSRRVASREIGLERAAHEVTRRALSRSSAPASW